jgi:superfamily I DNA/RNA helicase
LLKLAIALYEYRYGKHPGFHASEPDDLLDPDPLLLIQDNFNEKINWIAERISELYEIYGNTIPNIAVFVKDNQQIEIVVSALNRTDLLMRNFITAKSCLGESEIGSADYIRVFNISLIKGMEFESVFFIDVDEYIEDEAGLLDKLIYVGVSRATYYMAITLQRTFPQKLLPIKKYLKEKGNWSTNVAEDY